MGLGTESHFLYECFLYLLLNQYIVTGFPGLREMRIYINFGLVLEGSISRMFCYTHIRRAYIKARSLLNFHLKSNKF